MPNTDRFQASPDFFSSKEEGRRAPRENTNPRYKFFRQQHFTAGDYEQFMEFWDPQSHSLHPEPTRPGFFSEKELAQLRCPLYHNLSTNDVIHTFEYIFHKFKKGIFVKIVDNELRVFLPFSKVDFVNDWADRVKVNPIKYPRGIHSMIEASANRSGFKHDANKVHFMIDHWYSNNGLLRYEYPISENDSGVGTLRDMFMCLTRERKLPDCEFFVNKRDFPILRRDGMEAYDCIFGEKTPLVSHKHQTYCPIMGMTTTSMHADIVIPTWEDWARVSFPSKIFGKDFLEYPDPYLADFGAKKPIAVFRGASTGMGTTLDTNPRLRFAALSLEGRRDETDGELFLDCGITKWNCRPRRHPTSPYYDTMDQEILDTIPLASYLTHKEQAGYKYILHLPGHSEAYRLSQEMGMGSVILLYPCRYRLWFMERIEPYMHYVPLDPDDPEDIFRKIRWCKAHEKECERIARKAREFYERELSRERILDRLQETLRVMREMTGSIVFPRKSLMAFQGKLEREILGIETQILENRRLYPIGSRSLDQQDCQAMHPRTFQVLLHQMPREELLRRIEETPIHKQSRNMHLRRIVIGGRVICVKTPIHPTESTMLHECFVGQIGLNRIANVCPMIMYTHGRWGNHILSDFVEGETLEQILHTIPSYRAMAFFLSIMQQLMALMQYLQTELGFIHYDLYPWNVLITRNTTHRTLSLPRGATQSWEFAPEYFPILIDFGKSHIVYQNLHFVHVAPFHLHLHQDVISILVSSLYILVQRHKFSHGDLSLILRLVNYMGGTDYMRMQTLEHMSEVKLFLKRKKKYSNMLMNDKETFRDYPPQRFLAHLQKLTQQHNLRSVAKISRVVLEAEIYYSRFLILYELGEEDSLSLFLADNRRLSMHRLMHKAYIDYHILGILAPEHAIRIMLRQRLETWPEEKSVVLGKKISASNRKIRFPVFFSHPDLREIRSLEVGMVANHYYERHKTLMIMLMALEEFPDCPAGRGQATILGNPFLDAILGANRGLSIANHLCRYREWIEK